MRALIALAAVASLFAAPAHAANIVPTWSLFGVDGGPDGTLRPGSPWVAGSTPSNTARMADLVFQPEGTQWNNNSWWWDEVVTGRPVSAAYIFSQPYTIDHLIVQADDNDDYHVEYFSGGAWHTAWTAAATNTYGLTTRDSGKLTPFTTDRFRLSASNGDGYYAISEFQAFTAAVPEPATWGMMILGLGAIGGTLRRRARAGLRRAHA